MSDLRDLVEHDRLRDGAWSVRTARAFMDDVWIAELERQADAAGLNREPARAILSGIRPYEDDDED